MEDTDFERRRELRRQKREEMRIEAERLARNEDDEEEAARERRRRARQERMRSRDGEEPSGQLDGPPLANSHSLTETVSVSSSFRSGGGGGEGGDEGEAALLERMAKREERRQRRMQEALERQDLYAEGSVTKNTNEEEGRSSSWRSRGRNPGDEEEEEKPVAYGSRREKEQGEEEGQRRPAEEEVEEEAEQVEEEEEEEEEQREEEEVVEEEKPRRSYLREQESPEEAGPETPHEENGGDDANSVVHDIPSQEKAPTLASDEVEEGETTNSTLESKPHDGSEEDNEVSEILHAAVVSERGGARDYLDGQRKQNGGVHEESPPKQHRKPERTPSRGSVRSADGSPSLAAGAEEQDDAARLEAERKLEELKRRRDDAESEGFERMRQKQQEAEAELEELKRKREDRRKVLEEEEQQKKLEEADRRAKEEDEKRRMKEEIERRRAEAAEKRQKVDDTTDGEGKPFKCVSPRGSSLKIEERAEFLNKSAQKSSAKASHSPVVSKIDNRLEQYTSAAQRENRESRSPRSGAVDLPMATDSIRNIKSMWEKGNVFSSPGGGAGAYKETAAMKIGVAGRINDWLNKTPESGKTAGGRPADLKPVDVTNKRSLWENKGATPTKMTGRGETKSVTNGMGH